MGQKEIVIVEDHQQMLKALCLMLANETGSETTPLFYSPDQIENIEKQLAEIFSKNPGHIVVVCDGLHGDYKKILAQCKNAQIPFILHSGETDLIAEAKTNHVPVSLKDDGLDGIKDFVFNQRQE